MDLKNADAFAQMFARARIDAGKSQEFVAKALGVSKRTVQNWESGYSCPNQLQGFEFFKVLGLQPLPYYLEVLYPEFGSLGADSSDGAITDALCAIIKDLPPEAKRKMLFILAGGHGSSTLAVLDMVVAHLHTPLADRLNIASSILTNYEVAESEGTIVAGERIHPNIEFLNHSYQRGKDAVKQGRKEYDSII